MPLSIFRVAIVALFCFVGLWASERPAAAQTCNISITNLDFGSFQASNGAAVNATATLTATCSAPLLPSLLRVYICPYMGDGTGRSIGLDRTMVNGANKLRFQMYSSGTTIWGSPGWGGTTAPKLSVPLGLVSRTGTESWTIYGTVLSNQQGAAPGFYTSSMSGGHMNFRVGTSTSNCTSSYGSPANPQPSFTVSATVLPGCIVTTTDVDFGAKGVLDTVTDAQGSVSVRCASGTSWTASMALGSGEIDTARTMTNGAQNISYGLYKNAARNQPWSTGSQAVTGTGTGTQVNIPVYGRVPIQTTPPANTYTDTVILNLTY